MKPLILFDFDGTLAQSTQLVVDSLQAAAESRGKSVSFSAQDFSQHSSERVIRQAGFWFWQVPGFIEDFRLHVESQMHSLKVHDFIQPLLEDVSRYANLGIVSESSVENVKQVLAKSGLVEMFTCIRHAKYFSKSKVIKSVCVELEVARSNTLYVGDETRDIHAARRAGVECLGVSWGLQSDDVLLRVRPRMIAESAQEAEHLLKAWIATTN